MNCPFPVPRDSLNCIRISYKTIFLIVWNVFAAILLLAQPPEYTLIAFDVLPIFIILLIVVSVVNSF